MTTRSQVRTKGTKGVPREEREQMLLDIGERAFAERGYDAVTMEEVAAEAGVTKPMIYAYFGSKEGFFRAGVHRAYERAIERVERAVEEAGGDPADRLVSVATAVFAWVEDYRDLWPLVYGAHAVGGAVASEAAAARAGMVALIARILRADAADSVDAVETEVLAEASVAVNMAIADRWIRHPEEPRELQVQRSVRILAPSIEALAQGTTPSAG